MELRACDAGLPWLKVARSAVGRLAAGAALLAVAGCALLTATPPSVEVAQVTLRGATVLDQMLDIKLCVTNPNNTELSFRSVRVMVDVSGMPLADGVSEMPVRLPPVSSTLVDFAVATTTRNIGPQLLGVLQSGGLNYRMRGSVQLDGSLAITLPFSRSGQLDMLSAGGGLLANATLPSNGRCSRS